MSNVSDYKIAASIIREICKSKSKPFIDLTVSFEEAPNSASSNTLYVGECASIGQTIYKIVNVYINSAQNILGENVFSNKEEQDDFLIYVSTLIRRAVIGVNETAFDEGKPDEVFRQRLYQRPLVWSLLKNVVLPIYGKSPKNIALVCGTSPFIDIARYFKAGEVRHPNAPQDEFIFVNDDCGNDAVKNALLFIETLKAHDLSPNSVMFDLFESELYEKYLGALTLALSDSEQVEEFVAVVFAICGISVKVFPNVPQENDKIVTAQGANLPQTMPLQWWYSGLTEKMLQPARGPDWSTRMSLEGAIQEFWDQVELIKSRKKQGDGVPFNDLLRLKQLQTTEPIDSSRSLQALLQSQRIW